jgi:hypothetical protein
VNASSRSEIRRARRHWLLGSTAILLAALLAQPSLANAMGPDEEEFTATTALRVAY